MQKAGWTQQGGTISKWGEGEILEGEFVRIIPSTKADFSPVLIVNTGDGTARYWCPAVLESRLEGIREGAQVYIECLGKTLPIKGKGKAWDFDVFTK